MKNKLSRKGPCPESIMEKFDDYLLGKLSDQDIEIVETALMECDDCLKKLTLREKVIGVIREEGSAIKADLAYIKGVEPNLTLETPRAPAWYKYAFIAAAIVMIIFSYRYLMNEKSPGKSADPIADLIAAHGDIYQPSPALEHRRGQVFRNDGILLDKAAPEDTIIAHLNPILSWQWKDAGFDPSDSVYVNIFNNQEQLIYRRMADGLKHQVEETLSPGLYYWTLERKVGDVFTGRIIVVSD